MLTTSSHAEAISSEVLITKSEERIHRLVIYFAFISHHPYSNKVAYLRLNE